MLLIVPWSKRPSRQSVGYDLSGGSGAPCPYRAVSAQIGEVQVDPAVSAVHTSVMPRCHNSSERVKRRRADAPHEVWMIKVYFDIVDDAGQHQNRPTTHSLCNSGHRRDVIAAISGIALCGTNSERARAV